MAHYERAMMYWFYKSEGRCESNPSKSDFATASHNASRVAARFKFIAKGKPKVERMSIQTSPSILLQDMAAFRPSI